MHFTVSRDDMQALLSRAAGTVSTKDVNAILKNFLLKAEAGKLKVMATDMSLGAVAEAALGTVTADGVTAVPAKKMIDMISALPSGVGLTFDLDGQVLTMFTDLKKEGDKETYRSKAVFHCMDPDMYPEFPVYKDDEAVITDLKQFLEGLAKISFATSDTELKANLMAVYVNAGVMYSADGHRACRWDIPECTLADLMVPNSATHLLVRLLRDSAAAQIKIQQTQFHILFKVGAEIYHCRKIEATFPDLEKKVFQRTQDYKFKMKFPKSRMLEAVKCAKVTADESAVISMSYQEDQMGSGQVTVKSSDAVEDSFEEIIPGCSWDGPTAFDREINFEYLEDVLKVMGEGGKVVEMVLGEDKDSRKSMFLFKHEKLTSVIMPRRASKDKKDQVHSRVKKHSDASTAKEDMGASRAGEHVT